jgi:hypothetical protein
MPDLFVATNKVARTGGHRVKRSNRVPLQFGRIPLATLCCLLAEGEGKCSIFPYLDAFEMICDEREDGPWAYWWTRVYRLPDDLVDRLCALSPSEITRVASMWGKTQELETIENRRPGTVAEMLKSIVELARQSRRSGKAVFLQEG